MFWTHYSRILCTNCLFGFCKMTFTLPLIFTSLAGIIFRPLFTAFCKCYRIWCLLNFFPNNFKYTNALAILVPFRIKELSWAHKILVKFFYFCYAPAMQVKVLLLVHTCFSIGVNFFYDSFYSNSSSLFNNIIVNCVLNSLFSHSLHELPFWVL